MEKINFEDGQLTKRGYVTIEGKEYPITEPEYDGATPLSAYVLNKLQDNIEEGINNIQALPIGGTKGQVLTKQSATNGDANWEDIEANEVYIGKAEEAPSSAKIIVEEEDFVESAGLSKAEVYVGVEEPVAGEKVWFRKGKQLFDKDNAVILFGFSNFATKTFTTNNAVKSIVINCSPKTTYTVSKIKSTRFSVSSYDKKIVPGVALTNIVENNNETKLTITTGDKDKYLCVFYYSSTKDTLTEAEIRNSIQIEEGKIATNCKEYIEPQIFVRNSSGVYEEFINKKELEKEIFVNKTPFTANEGYTIDLQYMNKQGKHYWGTVVFHKNSGMFGSSEIALKCNVELAQIFSYGCFLGTNTYNALAVGYLHLRANQELYVGDNNNTSKYNYARCFVDFIEI